MLIHFASYPCSVEVAQDPLSHYVCMYVCMYVCKEYARIETANCNNTQNIHGKIIFWRYK